MRRNFSILLTILSLFVLNINSQAQSSEKKIKMQTEIRAVLNEQVAAWNAGDIKGFMRGYWNSPDTTFSGKTLTRGWQTVFDNYQKNYDTPEKRGVLSFSNLVINVLSKDAAFVLGEWEIKSATNPKGRFTLVFRKTADGWRIIHDHTS